MNDIIYSLVRFIELDDHGSSNIIAPLFRTQNPYMYYDTDSYAMIS